MIPDKLDTMLSVASSLFGKSSTLSAYTLHSAGPSPSSSSANLHGVPSPSGRSSPAPPKPARAKPFNVGLWKVLSATHRTTGKDVSVWVFEKRVLDNLRSGREYVIEQLKKEATSLSRLRHPDILHMVEPLEESRSELTFVTELVTGSLGNVLSAAKRSGDSDDNVEVDLDEVEIQKGVLQVAKGLMFLHQQAKSVHLNLSPDAILINAKGDWKLSGLNLTTPLQKPDGTPNKAEYVEVDGRLPPQVQWKLDYLAPEYVVDSQLNPSNDLYSLGCVLYAVHMGGRPPFSNRGSLQHLRENADGPLGRREYARGQRWDRNGGELKDLLPRLLTRTPSGRISLTSLANHPFFSSLAISTLNFLDPTTFASKPREEKATFLRGLVRVLPNFSERLKKGKILLSLLEEMKDPYLLPFLLPNVFEISKHLSKEEFAVVLPKLQPLFVLKDPPQNMLTLMDNLALFEEKTAPAVFRESVMPLIYNSLESEHLPVQERVLKVVPHLCDILDYGTVQNVLLVKVAILFTRTRILSVKVQTLDVFRAMVTTLDTTTLTTKLVPLLSKIKTKEPAVMMATLGVHEAMGAKVSLESIATLVLPQLWSMSMGPLLNTDQFARFMAVIKSLGARVEKEHSQHLREVRKMEEQTSGFTNGASASPFNFAANNGGEVDFESLVKGGGGGGGMPSAPRAATPDPFGGDAGWDEGWEKSADEPLPDFPGLGLGPSSPNPKPPTLGSRTASSSSRLGATRVASATFNTSLFENASQPPSFGASRQPSFNAATSPRPSFSPLQPQQSLGSPSFAPMSAQRPSQPQALSSGGGGPNYNISIPTQAPAPRPMAPLQPRSPARPSMGSPAASQWPSLSAAPSAPTMPTMGLGLGAGGGAGMGGMGMGAMAPSQPAAPPGWAGTGSGLMQPSQPAKPAWGSGGGGAGDWGDFDPLK